MPFQASPADEQAIATIRTLAADVVAKANSGHPGELRCSDLLAMLVRSLTNYAPGWP